MSRIGKRVIVVPEKSFVTFQDGVFSVKGPQGQLTRTFKPDVDVVITGSEINLKPKDDTLETNALWGSYAAHITAMIKGVNEAYTKKLILEGIGYKSEVKPASSSQGGGDKLVMALGFSHPVNVDIPKTLKVSAEKNVITVSGIDKEEVGAFAANLRAMKKPEPYKGKGFRYEGEVIKRKQGKKTA